MKTGIFKAIPLVLVPKNAIFQENLDENTRNSNIIRSARSFTQFKKNKKSIKNLHRVPEMCPDFVLNAVQIDVAFDRLDRVLWEIVRQDIIYVRNLKNEI